MIKGLFLDPRAWSIDFQASSFWQPEKYGLSVDLHSEAFNIPQRGIDPKYKFVIATEVWELPMQKTLGYLKSKGLKIFLAAREPIKYGELIDAMFSYEKFRMGNSCYFMPDMVLAAGPAYAELWKDKTKTAVTGYPRWDWYVSEAMKLNKAQVAKAYGLEADRKWLFFSDYPPYHYKKVGGKDTMVDLFDEREAAIETLIGFAQKYSGKYQVVIKIHPASMKPFLKKTGKGNEVAGLTKRYYQQPTKDIKVIGDVRSKGNIAKELLATSDFILGYNSTMLIEGMLMNKPITSAIFGKCKDIATPYSDLWAVAYDKNELLDALEEFDSGLLKNEPVDSDRELVERYLHKVDGKCCERMCEVIKREL